MGGSGRPSGDTPDAERDANVCVPLSVYTPPCRAKNARRGWGTRFVSPWDISPLWGLYPWPHKHFRSILG